MMATQPSASASAPGAAPSSLVELGRARFASLGPLMAAPGKAKGPAEARAAVDAAVLQVESLADWELERLAPAIQKEMREADAAGGLLTKLNLFSNKLAIALPQNKGAAYDTVAFDALDKVLSRHFRDLEGTIFPAVDAAATPERLAKLCKSFSQSGNGPRAKAPAAAATPAPAKA
jgi:hypothetical protein